MTGDIATSSFQGYWPSIPNGSAENRVMGIEIGPDVHHRAVEEPTSESCWGSECAYGEVASGRLMVTNLRLPGQYDERLLGSLGLQGPYYNWNRWYLPSVGRYLELDPIAKAGAFNGFYGPNWYGYAEGNPLRWTDPTGRAVPVVVPVVVAGADAIADLLALAGIGCLLDPSLSYCPGNRPQPKPPQPVSCHAGPAPQGPPNPAPAGPYPGWWPSHGPARGGGCPPCVGPEQAPIVHTTHSHGNCPGAHVHYSVWEQDPKTCICHSKQDRYACL